MFMIIKTKKNKNYFYQYYLLENVKLVPFCDTFLL